MANELNSEWVERVKSMCQVIEGVVVVADPSIREDAAWLLRHCPGNEPPPPRTVRIAVGLRYVEDQLLVADIETSEQSGFEPDNLYIWDDCDVLPRTELIFNLDTRKVIGPPEVLPEQTDTVADRIDRLWTEHAVAIDRIGDGICWLNWWDKDCKCWLKGKGPYYTTIVALEAAERAVKEEK